MSSTTAISTALSQPPGPAPQAAVPRRLSNEEDLYAEGNSFSDADWAGPEITDLFGKDGFDFKDVLDVINPLHHLPVIGTAYRALTGDELAAAPRVLGGALFGGIAGFVVSLANAVLENETGSDMGDSVLALFDDDAAAAPAVASAPAAAPEKVAAATPLPGTPDARTVPASALPAAFGQIKAATAGNSRPANESEDPVAALIRARAAVPARSGSNAGGIPQVAGQSSIVLPGGKTLPIQFRSKETAAALQQSHHPSPQPAPKPTPSTASTAIVATAVDAAKGPRTLRSATATEATQASKTSTARPDAAPDAEIALKMRTALDKYERLMKSRTAPSISGEI